MKIQGKIFRKLSPFFRFIYRIYASFDHSYTFRGLKIAVNKGTFNPVLFHSTIDLIEYIDSLDKNESSFLELGCGSAMASIYFSKKGLDTTAIDLSEKALENGKKNASLNNLTINFKKSDLYENTGDDLFDIVFINPPYFPRDAESEEDIAWFCGPSFEYYENLFEQMKSRQLEKELTLMVLSDQCDIGKIEALAIDKNLTMEKVFSKEHLYESILIYRISPSSLP